MILLKLDDVREGECRRWRIDQYADGLLNLSIAQMGT